MSHPLLLGSTLTDDEFKHLCDLTNLLKYPIKDISYFWVQSDLSIGCDQSYFFDKASDRQVETVDEFLSYIKEQKLLRILE